MKPSLTLLAKQIKLERIKKNLPVYDAGLGENPMPIPEILINETKKYSHLKNYTDAKGISKLKNILGNKRLEGASTITQQVAKNFLLTNEVSIKRKIKEAILAFRIEKAYSKKRILELYLNQIYLGQGTYGVAAASLEYFDKSIKDLSYDEAALLAASS